jgi:3',5'-cyclic AMP phosphodiesterase CpdA
MKMIVTHHPFEMPVDRGPSVGRARIALNRLSECRVDLFLAGHFHVSSVAPTTFNVPAKGYSSLIIQAGTALSTRTRSEHNNFNVIRVELPELLVERVNWNPEAPAFTVAATERFLRTPNGWGRIGQNSRPGSAPGSSSHKR